MAKKVVISGYYGSDNFGDETILKVLIDKLKEEKADNRECDGRIFGIGNLPCGTENGISGV